MSSIVALAGLVLGSLVCLCGAAAAARRQWLLDLVGPGMARRDHQPTRTRRGLGFAPREGLLATRTVAIAAGAAGGLVGVRLAGPVGLVVGAVTGGAIAQAWARRRSMRDEALLELQLAELVETCAQAVRGGLSLFEALDHVAVGAAPPIGTHLSRLRRDRELGTPLEDALGEFAGRAGTDDARLFSLVAGIHLRSGGNLAEALDEVASTIRHRMAVRRELRALSAQGRISGTVLCALPIGFFLLVAATSHRDMGPVYRSSIGMTLVISGLVLQGLAYGWIRRLMRVAA